MNRELIIIGGGPAGYVAAIRAAQSGIGVRLIEKGDLGGTCLNAGCLPTKVLLRTGEFYHNAKMSAVPGVKSTAELDWLSALAHKHNVVRQLRGGISRLLESSGVQVITGCATVLPGLNVMVGEERLSADFIILATGSINAEPRFEGNYPDGVIYSDAALALQKAPKSIVVVGGGVIGIEFATLFAYLGADVTVVEKMPELLPSADREIAGLLRKKMAADGVKVFLNARLDRVEKTEENLIAHIHSGDHTEEIQTEKVLIAVGRRPNTSQLGLEALGVAMDGDSVVVDSNFQTNVKGLYAVGDCNASLMLAHAAMAQGITAVDHFLGEKSNVSMKNIPSCVYSSPEIASVGKTEQELKEEGIPYETGRFSLSGNGKAIIESGSGLIKILADKDFGEVFGVHMIGPNVTEMIAEAAICMQMEGTVDDIIRTIHPHPTVSESLWEAAMAVKGRAIHGV